MNNMAEIHLKSEKKCPTHGVHLKDPLTSEPTRPEEWVKKCKWLGRVRLNTIDSIYLAWKPLVYDFFNIYCIRKPLKEYFLCQYKVFSKFYTNLATISNPTLRAYVKFYKDRYKIYLEAQKGDLLDPYPNDEDSLLYLYLKFDDPLELPELGHLPHYPSQEFLKKYRKHIINYFLNKHNKPTRFIDDCIVTCNSFYSKNESRKHIINLSNGLYQINQKSFNKKLEYLSRQNPRRRPS